MNLLITGSTGFVGSNLIDWLTNRSDKSINILTSTLRLESLLNSDLNIECDTAVHLAGLAHKNSVAESDFELINTKMAIELASQLADNGMKRFIFISSIGVNGVCSKDVAFSEKSLPNPHSPYALSKFKAEEGLKELANKKGFELVIIRPPLIYGKNAPGNFDRLMKLSMSKLPLPFGLVKNKRSFISIYNLCEFIEITITNPKAANELFLISDDEFYSTQTLIKKVWLIKNISSFMFPLPIFLFRWILKLLGKTNISTQLFDNLEIDTSKAKKVLDWKPKYNLANTLEEK